MKNSRIKIFIAIATLVLAGGAYYLAKNRPTGKPPAPEVQNQALSEGQKIYKNIKYGFSFGYPKEFTISEFTESNADVVLISDAKASGIFQISVSPWDEPFDSTQGKPGPITKERILKDIPDMRISNDKEISVGGFDKITASGETDSTSSPQKALSFISKDELGNETQETWFVHNGNLYQISALSSFEGELLKILATWKFQ